MYFTYHKSICDFTCRFMKLIACDVLLPQCQYFIGRLHFFCGGWQYFRRWVSFFLFTFNIIHFFFDFVVFFLTAWLFVWPLLHTTCVFLADLFCCNVFYALTNKGIYRAAQQKISKMFILFLHDFLLFSIEKVKIRGSSQVLRVCNEVYRRI